MGNLFTSLFNYKVKRAAILIAIVIFITDMLVQIFGNEYINSYQHHVLFHYLIMISLFMAISSKDKIDDELSMRIRYAIYKTTFGFVVVLFGILAIILSMESIEKLSTLTIIYCLEGLMLLHLILYQLGVRYSPKWLLEEQTAPKEFNLFAVIVLIVFFGLILFLIISGILVDLKS